MKKTRVYLFSFFLIAALFYATADPAAAQASYYYGLAVPLTDYTRTNVAYYLPEAPGAAVIDENIGANTTSALNYAGNNGVQCSLTVTPYALHGITSAGDLSAFSSPYLTTFSSFRDQIYFQTYNHQPAELVLNFDVDLSWASAGPGSDMHVEVVTTARSTNNIAYPVSSDVFWQSFSGDLSVSSLENPTYGGLVLSDSYFAYSFGMWADINNGTIDWSNSITLDPNDPYSVYQYDQAGNRIELAPGQYTLISQNTNFPSTVPEPATMLLLGLGLMGVLGIRRKMQK